MSELETIYAMSIYGSGIRVQGGAYGAFAKLL